MLYVDLENEDGTVETLSIPINAIYRICKKCGQKCGVGGLLRFCNGEDPTNNYIRPDCEEENRLAMSEKKRLQFCKKHGLPEVWTDEVLKECVERIRSERK